jgi:hypothetical protein
VLWRIEEPLRMGRQLSGDGRTCQGGWSHEVASAAMPVNGRVRTAAPVSPLAVLIADV